jgi:TRAP-type mannitol/chloroaromatic compound transport system permease small subunit
MESAELPVTYPEECVMNFVTSYFSLSSNSSGIEFVQDSNFQVGHSNKIQRLLFDLLILIGMSYEIKKNAHL